VSRQEEVQNVTTPLSVLLVGSFLLAIAALGSPDSTLVRVASIVPPFSTMVMPIRWAADEAPLWELGLAIGLMLVVVVALVRFAGWVYAGAVLRSGPRVKLADALAAGRQGDRTPADLG
jgi:ABC-2 type transport system permease protein